MNNLINALYDYGIKQVGTDKYLCRCPSHNDKSPSLTITLQPNDKTLIHCFAGCQTEDILSSIGLSMSDLFPDDGDFNREEYKQQKSKAQLRKEFMGDYRLIQLGEAWIKAKKIFTNHDKQVFKEAIRRVENYKFNAHKAYAELIKQDATQAHLDSEYYIWQRKTMPEKYGEVRNETNFNEKSH